MGELSHNQQEVTNQVHEQFRQYFAGLARNTLYTPLSSEMMGYLNQLGLQYRWIDSGDVKSFMRKETVMQILSLPVQRERNELLMYFLRQDPEYVIIIMEEIRTFQIT